MYEHCRIQPKFQASPDGSSVEMWKTRNHYYRVGFWKFVELMIVSIILKRRNFSDAYFLVSLNDFSRCIWSDLILFQSITHFAECCKRRRRYKRKIHYEYNY